MIQLHPKSIILFLIELHFTVCLIFPLHLIVKEDVQVILTIWPLFQSYCLLLIFYQSGFKELLFVTAGDLQGVAIVTY